MQVHKKSWIYENEGLFNGRSHVHDHVYSNSRSGWNSLCFVHIMLRSHDTGSKNCHNNNICFKLHVHVEYV